MRKTLPPLLFSLLLCCSGTPDPDEAVPFVQRFLDAIEAGDCATIRSLSVKEITESECQELVTIYRRRGVKLLEILHATVDGRFKDAVIVKTRIEEKGQPKERLFRVEYTNGAWKLRL